MFILYTIYCERKTASAPKSTKCDKMHEHKWEIQGKCVRCEKLRRGDRGSHIKGHHIQGITHIIKCYLLNTHKKHLL